MTPNASDTIEVLALDDEKTPRPERLGLDEIEEDDEERSDGCRYTIPWDWEEDDDW